MTVYPNPAHRTPSDSHKRHLALSAIDPKVTEERGTYTAVRGKDVPQDGGKLPTKPGIVFPVHTLDGETFHRLRPDNPGRLPKYMQPKAHANRLDVHPRQHEAIKRPGGRRYITEGEKKTDSGVSKGLLMVGLSGVWNYQKDGELISDWDHLPLDGGDYAICFDSDIQTNEHVQLAADRLARSLRVRGANVYITLLPPGPGGDKQGLDDFFASGGTVKQLEMLTRPYETDLLERVRLTKDGRLRGAVEAMERKWWATEWSGRGGHTARDLALMLIEAARKHGKVIRDDLRVTKARGPLMLGAKIGSNTTMCKAVKHLEEIGFCERDNAGRGEGKAGAFIFRGVARAKVYQYGEKPRLAGETSRDETDRAFNGTPLRAPRLMWASPRWKPSGKMIREHRMGTRSYLPEPRPGVARLGKIRGAILDALDAAGGTATIQEIADALRRKRPRDIRRRDLPGLEEAGILAVEGDTVTLAPDWPQMLEDARRDAGEIEAGEVAAERYRAKSRDYHARLAAPAGATPAGLAAVKRSNEKRGEHMAQHEAHQAVIKRQVKRYVYDRMRTLGRIRLELLREIVAADGGPPSYTLPAAKSLGCTVERLPEYEDAEFVFAPKEWAA